MVRYEEANSILRHLLANCALPTIWSVNCCLGDVSDNDETTISLIEKDWWLQLPVRFFDAQIKGCQENRRVRELGNNARTPPKPVFASSCKRFTSRYGHEKRPKHTQPEFLQRDCRLGKTDRIDHCRDHFASRRTIPLPNSTNPLQIAGSFSEATYGM